MRQPVHAYRTTGFRVVRGGIPIYAECGHIAGVAFGVELKVVTDLRDSPAQDTRDMLAKSHDLSMDDMARLAAIGARA